MGTMSHHATTDDRVDVVDEDTQLLDEPSRNSSSASKNQPKLTYFDAFALLVSLQIGSGIFSSPSSVDKHTPAPGYAIIIWLFSGLLAWTGAACYAELGSALPVSGGTQEYLKYIFGDGLAFMSSWIWIMAIKPSSMAALSVTFAQYWINFMFNSSDAANGWQGKVLALVGFAVVVFFNMVSIKATIGMTRFFLTLKLLTLLLLLICTVLSLFFGIHLGEGTPTRDWSNRNWFSTTNPTWQPGIWNSIGQSTIAMYAGLWAYSGWDNANMVAGDMRNSSRDLPRAIHTAQPVVIFGFILANICYYITVPWSQISNTNTIAVVVGNNILGWVGSLSFAALVSLACLGSLNVNVFTTSRLIVSAAQADWFPSSFGKFTSLYSFSSNKNTSSPNQTPINAMLLTTTITTIYILLGTFRSLITFIGLAEYLFFSATAIGLLVLRIREPNLTRPYKPSIVIPVIFAAVSLFLVVCGAANAPMEAGVLGGLIGLGVGRKVWGRVWGVAGEWRLSQA